MIEMSAEIDKLAAAMVKAQAAMPTADESSENPHFKSSYADLAECVKVARPVLTANGLAIMQFPSTQDRIVSVTTMVVHESGQWIRESLSILVRDAGPHAVGGGITYGKRYGYAAAVNLTTGERDDDGTAAESIKTSDKKQLVVFDASLPAHGAQIKKYIKNTLKIDYFTEEDFRTIVLAVNGKPYEKASINAAVEEYQKIR